MNAHGHSKYALVLAANARCMGMMAENMQCQYAGNSMTHYSDSFAVEAHQMELLAREISESGWQP